MVRSLISLSFFILLSSCVNTPVKSLSNSSHKIPIFFPISKENGQFYTIPCIIDSDPGHCIVDTGMNQTQIGITPKTLQFKLLYKAKIFSMYGEYIDSVVEIPNLILGSDFIQQKVSATRSNSFHHLPSYLAVIGSDIFTKNNFILDFGTDEINPAQLIIDPNNNDLTSFKKAEFGEIIKNNQAIVINLTIETQKIKALWDTHAPVSAFSTNFINSNPIFFKLLESQKDKDAHGMEGKQNFYQLLKPVCFAHKYCPYTTNYVVEHKLNIISEEYKDIDAILGNDFINSFNWYFDFKNQKYSVIPR